MTRLSVLAAAVVLALPAAAETHDVTMPRAAYAPASLTVRVGDTIRFVNDDGTSHQVFVAKVGYAFDLRAQPPGETREMVMLKAGSFEVECVLHEHMRLAVEVQP